MIKAEVVEGHSRFILHGVEMPSTNKTKKSLFNFLRDAVRWPQSPFHWIKPISTVGHRILFSWNLVQTVQGLSVKKSTVS